MEAERPLAATRVEKGAPEGGKAVEAEEANERSKVEGKEGKSEQGKTVEHDEAPGQSKEVQKEEVPESTQCAESEKAPGSVKLESARPKKKQPKAKTTPGSSPAKAKLPRSRSFSHESPERLKQLEKGFILDGTVVSKLYNDETGRTQPSLNFGIPQYNALRDKHCANYFRSKQVPKLNEVMTRAHCNLNTV